MTIQITIIGLGQIGASIGLALEGQEKKLSRVGHDREFRTARYAEKLRAVDKVEINLPKSVKNADLVLLSLPIDQIKETMELIAPDLKEDVVVMDTCPVKGVIETWAAELFPDRRYYVGLTPVLNPIYLHVADSGVETARSDLFHGGIMAIAAPPDVAPEAVKMAADLARLVGAAPLFADPVELDGLMAATHLLPQLMAAGLLNATIDQPGWLEGSKVAGKAYAEASAPIVHLDDTESLVTSVLLNRENTLRTVDTALSTLQAIRNDINANDRAALQERLKRARLGRETWWQDRLSGDVIQAGIPRVEKPERRGFFARMVGMRSKPKPKE